MSQESGNWRLDVSVEPFPSRLVFMQYLSIKKTAFLFFNSAILVVLQNHCSLSFSLYYWKLGRLT